jgi:hypothetical protein
MDADWEIGDWTQGTISDRYASKAAHERGLLCRSLPRLTYFNG